MKALQKVSKFLSDYTSIVVIAIAVVTFFLPSMMGWVNLALFTDMVSNKFTCQSIIIGIIMFSMGLTLTTEDFRILAQRPFDISRTCMCCRRCGIFTGSQVLPVRCCDLRSSITAQRTWISAWIWSRKTGWYEYVKEENHFYRSRYAECRTCNESCNYNCPVCIYTGICNYLCGILYMAFHLRNSVSRIICNA